jgi:hypothetical protein
MVPGASLALQWIFRIRANAGAAVTRTAPTAPHLRVITVVTTRRFSKNSRNIDLPVTMAVHTK